MGVSEELSVIRRKAFTLIELLVVIAIIAILAAILFPVFAQAKVAAKKTAAISNQAQIGKSILLYMIDYDDIYPRNDECVAGSSLNKALNGFAFNPAGEGCNWPRFYYRVNHYSWQKWVFPYMGNVDIFTHPGRAKLTEPWDLHGEIMGGFALNLSLTGALNTWQSGSDACLLPNAPRGCFRNSFVGGRQARIRDVAKAMLLFDFGNPGINFAPVIADNAASEDTSYTVYPPAVREWWARNLMIWSDCTGWNMNEISDRPDPRATIGGGIVLGFADSHSRFYPAQKFLGETPLMNEYIVGGSLPGGHTCGLSGGVFAWDADVDLTVDYPLWALGGF
ncbi:MAG: prepilin-type N-terminal cleavage/methylation domain-containing protein [Armatimonadetes bacterium]|nr:prepilin-type N-terminal cleavage/methylation domain-containing protein [Armatimonadota bacterium]